MFVLKRLVEQAALMRMTQPEQIINYEEWMDVSGMCSAPGLPAVLMILYTILGVSLSTHHPICRVEADRKGRRVRRYHTHIWSTKRYD